eukprot:PhF_6_TR39576/c0_g1_i1/m.58664
MMSETDKQQQQLPPPPPFSSYTTRPLDRWCWYSFDWANSAYNNVVIGVFGPLLIDSLANMYAITRAGETAIPACVLNANNTYVYPNKTGCIRCAIGYGDQIFTSETTFHPAPVRTVIGTLQPSAFAMVVIALSVFSQAICFVSFGALADYSSLRKQLLLTFSWMGAG